MEQTILNNGTYVQISVSENQKIFARQLVEHSLHHHKVANIWDRQLSEFSKSRLMRYTGTLGEVVFADAYHLPRPVHSFGASSGQDLGQDFEITSSDSHKFSIDIKSMKRHSGVLSGHYVLNIQAVQLHRNNSKTSHYFCISFHQSEKEGTIASLLASSINKLWKMVISDLSLKPELSVPEAMAPPLFCVPTPMKSGFRK